MSNIGGAARIIAHPTPVDKNLNIEHASTVHKAHLEEENRICRRRPRGQRPEHKSNAVGKVDNSYNHPQPRVNFPSYTKEGKEIPQPHRRANHLPPPALRPAGGRRTAQSQQKRPGNEASSPPHRRGTEGDHHCRKQAQKNSAGYLQPRAALRPSSHELGDDENRKETESKRSDLHR
jgi:hypothetical protein